MHNYWTVSGLQSVEEMSRNIIGTSSGKGRLITDEYSDEEDYSEQYEHDEELNYEDIQPIPFHLDEDNCEEIDFSQDGDDDYEREGYGQEEDVEAADSYDDYDDDSGDKSVRSWSFFRSSLINHRVLVFLVVICSFSALCLTWMSLAMKAEREQLLHGDTQILSLHLFSDSLHDSAMNHHIHRRIEPIEEIPEPPPLKQLITTSNLKIKEESVEEVRRQPEPPKASVAPWEGCEDHIPNPDYRKHIVRPPAGPVTLVCCNTTKGPLSIEVHPAWAPVGADFFLSMVKDNFFSSKVPLFRALKNFLVQFGLNGDPEVQKRYFEKENLKDDHNWLPEGPPGREINGVKRFQKGYMAYAGAGKNSRGTQLIMAFQDNLYLGGGSPWEVPWGQVVGDRSFETMSKIYTGYGEKPSQGKIINRGVQYTQEEFPLMDYVLGCVVVKEDIPWNYVGPQ